MRDSGCDCLVSRGKWHPATARAKLYSTESSGGVVPREASLTYRRLVRSRCSLRCSRTFKVFYPIFQARDIPASMMLGEPGLVCHVRPPLCQIWLTFASPVSFPTLQCKHIGHHDQTFCCKVHILPRIRARGPYRAVPHHSAPFSRDNCHTRPRSSGASLYPSPRVTGTSC